ncbi:DUF6099 family protein [Streptomyces sp. NBC_00178]|uniref:DUF6099 family protein n=1 Tax=Streptomyces sp. NBC_00178 TaxID=2975672 RepID=UPI002E2C9FC2|nr:DUF6099 family protein [Streptomyces sp. NBC_00178]
MEAERLIEAGRRALADSADVPAVMAEAWQAQVLARAMGGHLARCGPAEVRTEAGELSDTGAPGGPVSEHPVVIAGGVRASQLTAVTDVAGALAALAHYLGEVGIALVGVACGTDEEGLYWQCIEAIDAADESVDRVHGMLRRLAEHERERDPGGERDGPYGVIRGPADPVGGRP